MGMSNREITAIEREARSREEMTKAINSGKGKEFRKENDRRVQIMGGEKKLAEVEKVLAAVR